MNKRLSILLAVIAAAMLPVMIVFWKTVVGAVGLACIAMIAAYFIFELTEVGGRRK